MQRHIFSSLLLFCVQIVNAYADTSVVSTINKHCIAGMINTYGANFKLGADCGSYTIPNSCSPDSGVMNGVNSNWRGSNAVSWLIGELQQQYNLGIRKAIINRPMGGSGSSHVTGAAWLTIPKYKRDSLIKQLQPWLSTHPDFILGVFIGSRWIKTDSLMGYHTGMGVYPGSTYGFDPLDTNENKAWHEIIDPWYSIGVRWVVIDNASSSTNCDWLLRLASYEKKLRGVEITGEAIPFSPGHHKQASWMALAPKYIDRPSTPHTNLGPLAFNDSNTTWYAWLNLKDLDTNINPQTYIQSLINRGYVVVATTQDIITYNNTLKNLIDSCSLINTNDSSIPNVNAFSKDESSINLEMFPNPNNGIAYYSFHAEPGIFYTMEVKNILGETMFVEKINTASGVCAGEINLRQHGMGCYNVMLIDGRNNRCTKTVIVH